jgi:hypothetical protein
MWGFETYLALSSKFEFVLRSLEGSTTTWSCHSC